MYVCMYYVYMNLEQMRQCNIAPRMYVCTVCTYKIIVDVCMFICMYVCIPYIHACIRVNMQESIFTQPMCVTHNTYIWLDLDA